MAILNAGFLNIRCMPVLQDNRKLKILLNLIFSCPENIDRTIKTDPAFAPIRKPDLKYEDKYLRFPSP